MYSFIADWLGEWWLMSILETKNDQNKDLSNTPKMWCQYNFALLQCSYVHGFESFENMQSWFSVLFEQNLCQQIEYSEQWVSFGEDATRNFDHHSSSLDKKQKCKSRFQDMGIWISYWRGIKSVKSYKSLPSSRPPKDQTYSGTKFASFEEILWDQSWGHHVGFRGSVSVMKCHGYQINLHCIQFWNLSQTSTAVSYFREYRRAVIKV